MTQALLPSDSSSNARGGTQPIEVILSSSRQDSCTPGQPFDLSVTVQNLGDRDAVVDVWIDHQSAPIREWIALERQRLALGPHQDDEVNFRFNIPAEALPETYRYDLVVDATGAYPQVSAQRFTRQLYIQASERITVEANHPTFQLHPATSPKTPIRLRPGTPTTIEIQIDNRSERVDRFRLEALGVPLDWQTDIKYPRESSGPGLILEADSLGLNPGDRGHIFLNLTPSGNALAGSYIPTIRLYSQNNRDLHLLGMIYLQIEPVDLLQPTLQILRNQVRRPEQGGLFELQLSNQGNTPRTIHLRVDNLDEADSCEYTLDRDTVTLESETIDRIQIQAFPQKWWRRPLLGAGRFLNFRVELADAQARPIPLNSLQGNLIWLPRPWWQLLLAVLMTLGAIATLIFAIWWTFFRPPLIPRIVTFEVQDSQYSEASGDVAQVEWQLEHPHRIKTLKLSGYDPEGLLLSGPYIYELTDTLPSSLQSRCTLQADILWCRNVDTGARKPGEYQFELTVISKGRQPDTPIAQQSKQVEIEPKPIAVLPSPKVLTFFPSELTYLEPGTVLPERTDPGIPELTEQGIPITWVIDQPTQLQALTLAVRDSSGKLLGSTDYDLSTLTRNILPDNHELKPWCRVKEQLFCENVPTPIQEVGDYQFELTLIPKRQAEDGKGGEAETQIEPQTTEIITVQPRRSQIRSFLVDGREEPKRRIAVDPEVQGTPNVQLSWDILGGSTTTATLSPVPGDVSLSGGVSLPLPVPPGSQTFTLQANDATGEVVTRSITIETYDPTPTDPNAALAEVLAETLGGDSEPTAEPAPEPGEVPEPSLGDPSVAVPEVISPIEVPPRFDQ